MGALISREHRDKVLSYITLAEEEGLDIRCGHGVEPIQLDAGNQQVRFCLCHQQLYIYIYMCVCVCVYTYDELILIRF